MQAILARTFTLNRSWQGHIAEITGRNGAVSTSTTTVADLENVVIPASVFMRRHDFHNYAVSWQERATMSVTLPKPGCDPMTRQKILDDIDKIDDYQVSIKTAVTK